MTKFPNAADVDVETIAPSSEFLSIVLPENRDGSGGKTGCDAGGSCESTGSSSDDDNVQAMVSELFGGGAAESASVAEKARVEGREERSGGHCSTVSTK